MNSIEKLNKIVIGLALIIIRHVCFVQLIFDLNKHGFYKREVTFLSDYVVFAYPLGYPITNKGRFFFCH